MDLLPPLSECGLDHPMERFPLVGRGTTGAGRRTSRSIAESTSGSGSNAAAGTRATTSASARSWTNTDR